jgi:hypothetical protein
MATRNRSGAQPRRKAPAKRRARRGGRRKSSFWKWLKRLFRWGRKGALKAREAKTKAADKRAASQGVKPTRPTRRRAWIDTIAAHFATEWGDSDAHDIHDRAARERRQRLDRWHRFTCMVHTPPMQFASAPELNAHLLTDHTEQAQHPRGTQGPPVRHIPPTRRAQAAGSSSRPPNTQTTKRPGRRIGIRRKAVDKLAGNAQAQLGDIGSTPVRTVSQIEEVANTLEAIALQLQEAVEGFQHNARTSEEAPIDEGVLRQLNLAKEGAEMVARGAVRFLGSFHDYYDEDIKEAQARQRMSNEALTS